MSEAAIQKNRTLDRSTKTSANPSASGAGAPTGQMVDPALTARFAGTKPSDAALAKGATTVIGEIVSITGSHAFVMLYEAASERSVQERLQLGSIINVDAGDYNVLGLIAAMSVPAPSLDMGASDVRIMELELIGEFTKPSPKAPAKFRRGVSNYPTLGDKVQVSARSELNALFAVSGKASVRVGVVKQETSIPATINVNDVFARHSAILGTTGAGKSCAIALMLRAVIRQFKNAHIVILDPHNEYARCFDDHAMVFDPANFTLPYWLLTFDELVEVLYPERHGAEVEIEILGELIPAVKKMGAASTQNTLRANSDRRLFEGSHVTVDTPTPYRISDLLNLLDKALGGLSNAQNMAPYKKLRNRLYTISQDARYNFMFGSLSVQDTMVEMLSALFRLPVEECPVSIIELGGLPAEVAQVVVSVISRLAFEFGLWSHGASPIAIVLEDAHRFAPARPEEGFAPTRRALARIAKEGRKSGVSLWVASQRPTELDPTILSQCNTIFAMRLANQADQETLRAIVPDASTSLLSALPSLGTGEAIAVGEGIPLPARIRFDALKREHIPRSLTASFVDGWSVEMEEQGYVRRIVEQWRAQRLLTPDL
ncbi:MAG: DUF87 domain-containing protein [Pseudomonadota bacterium]